MNIQPTQDKQYLKTVAPVLLHLYKHFFLAVILSTIPYKIHILLVIQSTQVCRFSAITLPLYILYTWDLNMDRCCYLWGNLEPVGMNGEWHISILSLDIALNVISEAFDHSNCI